MPEKPPTTPPTTIEEFKEWYLSGTESDSIREFVTAGKTYFVSTGSLRYKIFSRDNFTCQICGLVGGVFYLKETAVQSHFNLYGTENGKLLLFTKDHIRPKSKSGRDVLDNLQTACSICNNLKGDKLLSNTEVFSMRKLLDENPNESREDLIRELGLLDVRSLKHEQVGMTIKLLCDVLLTHSGRYFQALRLSNVSKKTISNNKHTITRGRKLSVVGLKRNCVLAILKGIDKPICIVPSLYEIVACPSSDVGNLSEEVTTKTKTSPILSSSTEQPVLSTNG